MTITSNFLNCDMPWIGQSNISLCDFFLPAASILKYFYKFLSIMRFPFFWGCSPYLYYICRGFWLPWINNMWRVAHDHRFLKTLPFNRGGRGREGEREGFPIREILDREQMDLLHSVLGRNYFFFKLQTIKKKKKLALPLRLWIRVIGTRQHDTIIKLQ